MGEIIQFRQDEQAPSSGVLDFSNFLAGVFGKRFVDLGSRSAKFHRRFADDLEAMVQRFQHLLRNEYPCVQRLLDVGVLQNVAEVLKDCCCPFTTLPHITQQADKDFLRVFCWHEESPSLIEDKIGFGF